MTVGKLGAVILILCVVAVGWFILGGATMVRTDSASKDLGGAVAGLWGTEQTQVAPTVSHQVKTVQTSFVPGREKAVREEVISWNPVQLSRSDVKAGFRLDYRKKGLLWFSTYEVKFEARYTAANPFDKPKKMRVNLAFPVQGGVYDGFTFTVNGSDFSTAVGQNAGRCATLDVPARGALDIHLAYTTRGMKKWQYRFGPEVTNVKDFQLVAKTDFRNIDFPPETMSPTFKRQTARGWELTWNFKSLVSGASLGVQMPERLNPGPIASHISFFAPVSLLFFFTVLVTIGMARGVNLHPMHYFFLAAAFFAFDLLFAYLVDHIDINLAFVVSAVVSLALVVLYLRTVVQWRFALFTAGVSQLVFLILFAYAFFFKGYTGLTITIGAVLTLAILMWITARVNWDEVFVTRKTT